MCGGPRWGKETWTSDRQTGRREGGRLELLRNLVPIRWQSYPFCKLVLVFLTNLCFFFPPLVDKTSRWIIFSPLLCKTFSSQVMLTGDAPTHIRGWFHWAAFGLLRVWGHLNKFFSLPAHHRDTRTVWLFICGRVFPCCRTAADLPSLLLDLLFFLFVCFCFCFFPACRQVRFFNS